MLSTQDLALPTDTQHTITAYKAITKVLKACKATNTGGCKAFYTPKEWAALGHRYNPHAILIVVHDGGDLAPFFNPDYENYRLIRKMNQAIEAAGFWTESADCTLTYIYAA